MRDDRPLTEQFIRGLHEVLLGEPFHVPSQTAEGISIRKFIQPGQYKRQPNNVLTATGEMFYFASPEETPGRMTDLVDWYRAEEAAPTLHPVALAAEFHYRFVRIHPFDDGNGRMSRLLMNLILLRHGYPMTVIQAADRNRYLAALAEADAGEPEPFLRFIIENVEASLRLMIRAARGESIDEPSDLDKKLALLKKQVLSRKDAINLTWNSEVQNNFSELLLFYWLDDFTKQMIRFDDFFISHENMALFKTDSESKKKYDGDYQHKRGTLEEIQNFTRSALSNSNLISELIIGINWHNFRMLNHTFSMGVSVKFYFNNHKFEVKTATYEKEKDNLIEKLVFSSLYKSEYDQAQIHEINYQLANKVYDFIAAKLAEADTPPA